MLQSWRKELAEAELSKMKFLLHSRMGAKQNSGQIDTQGKSCEVLLLLLSRFSHVRLCVTP